MAEPQKALEKAAQALETVQTIDQNAIARIKAAAKTRSEAAAKAITEAELRARREG